MNKIKTLAIAIVFSLIITGCAMLEEQWASETEQELIAAGFITKLASTPEKFAQLEAMKQRTIVPRERNGKNFYIYADDIKKCMYVGDDKAFQKYQKIKLQKEMADEAAQAAADNRAAASYDEMAAEENSMDWGMWGPWYPYGW